MPEATQPQIQEPEQEQEQQEPQDQPSSPPETTEQPDSPDLSDRGIRHRDIIKPDVLDTVAVHLIGVGAIGSLIAKQLAHIGVPHMTIVDYDTVDVENLAVQGFLESDLGKLKVKAVAEACEAINSNVVVRPLTSKFRKEMIDAIDPADNQRTLIVSAVDSMRVRKQIWETYSEKFKDDESALFIDSRMAAEAARVLAVRGTEEKEYYERTLFSEGEGLQQSCTAKSTIYCANIAAGMVVAAFTKWLREMRPDRDVLFNIFASEVLYDSEALS